MGTFEFNQKGLDELNQQLEEKFHEAQLRGEAAATEQTPEAYAESVGRELSAAGVDVDHQALLEQYRNSMGFASDEE